MADFIIFIIVKKSAEIYNNIPYLRNTNTRKKGLNTF